MYPHTHSSRTAAGSCGRSKTTPNALLLARTPVSSCKRPYKASVQHWSQQLRPSVIAKAQPGPDKGSVAALEAALGAINNILGTYNKVKGGKAGSGSKRGGSSSKGGSQAGAAVSTGPSKLVSFSAKASSSVPVKETLTARAEAQAAAEPSSSNGSSHSTDSSNYSSSKHHQHTHSHSSSSSWLGHLTGKQPAGNVTKDGTELPQEALSRSLQAYLSLPLEQYSVLDPKLVTRLSAGVDVEAYLSQLLAEQKARKAERKAQQQQLAQQRQQQQQEQQQGLGAILDSADSSSSSGTRLEPKMRELQDQSSSSSSSSSGGAYAAATSQPASATITAAETPSAAAPALDDPAGAFLLRIPMMDLLGVDLEPLLVIYVDIDDKHGQVKFRANRLVIGDARFDQEFKVDLSAALSSKVTQQAVQVQQDSAVAAAAGMNSNASSSASISSSSSATTAAEKQGRQAVRLPPDMQQLSDAAATAVAEAVQTAVQDAAVAESRQLVWQRGSVLGCKVKLSMTLRLPHPLSMVPGPLLSTTAGLVAKLVMQALLPSFLELLATDYGRWASGSSTAARQALPAGSLVTAGKQQLQQLQK